MKSCPLVMCITNTVAANFTANVLLAIGAKPAMVEEPSEAAELASVADAALVNVGTVHPRQFEAMREAVRVMNGRSAPWVLDPVAVQSLSYRRKIVQTLISAKPTIIRGNAAEIDFILGTGPVFSGPVPKETAVLATGETDVIYGPDGETRVIGGVPMLTAVTATGCAQGAVCAALLGWGQAPKEACLTASRLMKRAGEEAAKEAKSPGSFQVALIDALWQLSPIRSKV